MKISHQSQGLRSCAIILASAAVLVGLAWHAGHAPEPQAATPRDPLTMTSSAIVSPASPGLHASARQNATHSPIASSAPPSNDTAVFSSWSEEELLTEVRKLDSELQQHEWIERANRDELSSGERAELGALLARRDALSIERADRLLRELARDDTR